MVKSLVLGRLQTNCYLVSDKKTAKTIIIDPGDDADYIVGVILKNHLEPIKIIATHGHFDHILAAFELQKAFNIPFLIHKKDEFLLKRMNQSAKYFTKVGENFPPKVNSYLKKGKKIKLGTLTLKIIETPGHTPGAVSLYIKNKNLIFVGDLLFKGGGIGRTDFSYCSHDALIKSINKTLKLPENTTIYSGHGSKTTVQEELKFHKLNDN